MPINEQIPLELGIGAIVATMLFGTCRTERSMESQYNSLAQQMQQRFAETNRLINGTNRLMDETDRLIDEPNQRIDDTHRLLDDLQTKIGEIRDDVRDLRSIHLESADAGAGFD